MTPRSESVRRGRPRPTPAAVRRRRAMRRRVVALLAAAGLGVLAATVLWPAVHQAVREITLPLRHEDIIRQQAARKRLDPALIAAVIYAESKFNPRDSSTGAKGLMQIQPETARFIARRSGGTLFQVGDLASPQTNISYGTYYLRYLVDRYQGNETLAIAAYNGGETNVDNWIARSGGSEDDFKVEQIPFAETRAYVERVLNARRDYRNNYRRELGL